MIDSSRAWRMRRTTVAGVMVLGLALAGCADTDTVSGDAPALAPGAQSAVAESSSPEPVRGHSAGAAVLRGEKLDRAFLLGMIPHHRAAVEMAQVVLEQGNRPEVQELARMIIADQAREIGEMQALREKSSASASP